MILEFINSDGRFHKNVAFFGFTLKVYTNYEMDELTPIKELPHTHEIIWRYKP